MQYFLLFQCGNLRRRPRSHRIQWNHSQISWRFLDGSVLAPSRSLTCPRIQCFPQSAVKISRRSQRCLILLHAGSKQICLAVTGSGPHAWLSSCFPGSVFHIFVCRNIPELRWWLPTKYGLVAPLPLNFVPVFPWRQRPPPCPHFFGGIYGLRFLKGFPLEIYPKISLLISLQ